MIQKSRQCIAWPYFSSLTCPKFVVGLVIVHSWRLALNHYKTFLDKLNEHGGAFGYIVLNYHLITKQKMFKRPKNWIFWTQMMIFLKLILLWVQLLVFDKKCSDFMKKGSMNYSNTLKKLAKHRSVSPQNVSPTNHLQMICNTSWLLLPECQFASKKLARFFPSFFKSIRNSSMSRTGVFIDKV